MDKKVKYRIRDIAVMAGVSTGTVDRVIHNRGDVSPESRKKVEDVLHQVNYVRKTHSNTPTTERQFRLLVIIPQSTSGEYWEQVELGIAKALIHFQNIKLKIRYLYYDQFDIYSCKSVYREAWALRKDAVIIGPSFYDETVLFANQLYLKDIPYVFVDTSVSNTMPLAIFSTNAFQAGKVQAKLLTSIVEPGKDIAFFLAKRIGEETSIQSSVCQHGFFTYLKENSIARNIVYGQYDRTDNKYNDETLSNFFNDNPNIGGAVVFNSCAHIIANFLKRSKMNDIKLIGFDINTKNVNALKDGFISFLLAEHPDYQGYLALKTLLEYLVYNKKPKTYNYTPIDIVLKETVDFCVSSSILNAL